MRLALLLAVLTLAFQVAEPPEYPDGWFCSPRGDIHNGTQTADYPCHCARMNHSDSCDDPKADSHDPGCGQFCHEQHCACPIACDAHKQ